MEFLEDAIAGHCFVGPIYQWLG